VRARLATTRPLAEPLLGRSPSSSPFASIRPMRRLLASLAASSVLLLLLAPSALAFNDGRGFYGATTDKTITTAAFILILFFPTFILVIQWRLDKRKYARKAAAKAHTSDASWRGGW
jgi:hypothetical protein